ncbi:hypothetical protein F8388_022165 [Cannabis sativa]|uniref:Uncharacterized protein n=1 Tax=Cannabis sativa TaxID=3483 RepID=A0A7J6G8D7_CANSA|nr:hypothetical protein F8388_022165 [Cannabis sativa]
MENTKFVQASSNSNQNQTSPLTCLRRELRSLPPLGLYRSIYRVPKRLSNVNEKAYTPQVVSIGPIHHGKKSLKPMEVQKKRYLRNYLEHTHQDMNYYVNIIKLNEEKLRNYYADPIEFSSDEFVKIVLVDATFIIEALLIKAGFIDINNNVEDCIFRQPWMLQDIKPDLLLLENQLPFFILEELFFPVRMFFSQQNISITKLAHNFFNNVVLHLEEQWNDSDQRFSHVEHFVDLFTKLSTYPVKPNCYDHKMRMETLYLPSATNLRQVGVKFKVRTTNLLDIQFCYDKGILEIPKLNIYDSTEIVIRNFVAFEQCHSFRNNYYITNYIVFLDYLINTPEDVELLVKYGIIANYLGDNNQVATMINKLGKGVSYSEDGFYFAEIFEQLCDYSKIPSHGRKANLKQNYFHSPWAGISAMLSVFCYTEFAVEIPIAGGSFSYLRIELGDFIAFIAAGNLILEAIIGTAAVGRSWSSYFSSLLTNDTDYLRIRVNFLPKGFDLWDPVAFLVIVNAIALSGTKRTSVLNWIDCILSLMVIVFIIVMGIICGDVSNLNPYFPNGEKGIFEAAAIVYMSYVGFDMVAPMAEETKQPSRDISIGLVGSMSMITANGVGSKPRLKSK